MRQHQKLLTELAIRAFFSVPEAARLIGCDERTLRKACAAGQVPGTRLGAKWLVPTAWLRRQLAQDGTEDNAA